MRQPRRAYPEDRGYDYGADNGPAMAPRAPMRPANPYPAAPAQAAQAHNPAFDQIQLSLERLAQKVNSLPRQQEHRPERPNQVDQSSILAEIRNGMNGLASELRSLVQGQTRQMDGELARIADGIAMLQNNRSLHPDYADQLHAELHSLRQGIDRALSRQEPHLDLSGVAQSIETGYSEIMGKLNGYFAALPSQPTILDVPDYSSQLDSLSRRLEEVTRAVVSLSVAPGDGGNADAFDRIEARLASLSRSVEDFHERTQHAPSGEASGHDFGGELYAEIDKLSQKLDNLTTMDQAGGQIFADMQGVNDRLEALQNDIGIIAASLENFSMPHAVAASGADPFMAVIEERLADLANRFDDLARHPGENANAAGEEILQVLRDLSDRMNRLEAPATGPGEDRLAYLEAQLSGIASHLETLGGTGASVDLSPINHRLDNIEGQIAQSRDIVIDLANEAARSAANGNGAAFAPVFPDLSEMMDEIRQLREIAGASRQEDMRQLGGIVDTISAIAGRLEQIGENFDRVGTSHAAAMPVHPAHQPASAHFGAGERVHETVGRGGSERHLPEAAFAAQEYADIGHAPSLDAFDEPASAARPSGPRETELAAPAEDVPLAPGSGMPDLEALVRRATNRKREKGKEEDVDSGIADLMASARKAAQAASLEAEKKRAATEAEGKTRKFGKFALPGFLNKRNLMVSAAVIAIAVGGMTFAPRIIGMFRDAPPANVSQVDKKPAAKPAKEKKSESAAKSDDKPAADSAASMANATGGNADSSVRVIEDTVPGNSVVEPSGQQPVALEAAAPLSAASAEQSAAPSAAPSAIMALAIPDFANDELAAAANNGDGNALFEIGRRLTDGDGVERDLAAAIAWYEKAAEVGHGPSRYRLGNFYENGHGVERDYVRAADWYQLAAEQGNALAMHNLAVLNAKGDLGSDPDMKSALEWFTRAAELGVKDSQVNLGILYTKGMGTRENLEEAYKWFAIAAKAGDQDAASKRDTLAQILRPEQLEQARGAAEIWKPTPIDAGANVAEVRPEWKSGAPVARISQADMVRQAQALLTRAGFDPGPADGIMGAKTRDAIRAFQEKSGLPADGQVSPALLDALSKTSI